MFKNILLICLSFLMVTVNAKEEKFAAQDRVAFALADGFQETPAAIFTTGKAFIRLVDKGEDGIEYFFDFHNLQGDIEMSAGAHIHFGRPGVNGGIIAFICGTEAVPGPPDTPLCFSDGNGNGSIHGIITAQDILPIEDQNFPGQSLSALRYAVLKGSAYLNVHTDAFPSGEIRGNFGKSH